MKKIIGEIILSTVFQKYQKNIDKTKLNINVLDLYNPNTNENNSNTLYIKDKSISIFKIFTNLKFFKKKQEKKHNRITGNLKKLVKSKLLELDSTLDEDNCDENFRAWLKKLLAAVLKEKIKSKKEWTWQLKCLSLIIFILYEELNKKLKDVFNEKNHYLEIITPINADEINYYIWLGVFSILIPILNNNEKIIKKISTLINENGKEKMITSKDFTAIRTTLISYVKNPSEKHHIFENLFLKKIVQYFKDFFFSIMKNRYNNKVDLTEDIKSILNNVIISNTVNSNHFFTSYLAIISALLNLEIYLGDKLLILHSKAEGAVYLDKNNSPKIMINKKKYEDICQSF